MRRFSFSEKDTEQLGFELAMGTAPGTFIALRGDLGAGKTAFVRGFAHALGEDEVSSPTFTIVHEYDTSPPIYHFDCYRLTGEDDLWDIGFSDYLDRGNIILMEWPERVEDALPKARVEISINVLGDEKREIIIKNIK